MNPEELAKNEARPYLADAKNLAAALSSASNSEAANDIMNQLANIASLPEIAAFGPARGIVNSYVNSAKSVQRELEAKEAAAEINLERQHQQQAAQYKIDPKEDKLANMLDIEGFFSKTEKAYLESINPDEKRKITTITEKGEITGEEDIDGQRMRDSLTIQTARGNIGKLSPEALKEYNLLVYGKEEGPQTPEDRDRGAARLKQAALDVEGDVAARAEEIGMPEEAEKAAKRAKIDIEHIERVTEMEKRRDAMPNMSPEMNRATGQALKDAELDLTASFAAHSGERTVFYAKKLDEMGDFPDTHKNKTMIAEKNTTTSPSKAASAEPAEEQISAKPQKAMQENREQSTQHVTEPDATEPTVANNEKATPNSSNDNNAYLGQLLMLASLNEQKRASEKPDASNIAANEATKHNQAEEVNNAFLGQLMMASSLPKQKQESTRSV